MNLKDDYYRYILENLGHGDINSCDLTKIKSRIYSHNYKINPNLFNYKYI